MVVIKTVNLVKKFNQFCAVQDLSLEIRAGEVFGLLGPNGAGKSTFISMLYGQVMRTSGSLQVLQLDPQEQSGQIKQKIGVVTQDNALDESLSVLENMLVYASFVGIKKIERKAKVQELLKYFNLAHKANAPIRALSGGMKRRLVFVRALLGNPEILILDEPTTGLDPAVRHLLWGKVQELKRQGMTILLTTHYMHEAEVLCDRLVIMNQGKIIAEGSPQDLIRQHTPGYVAFFSSDQKEKIHAIAERISILSLDDEKTGMKLRVKHLDDLRAFYNDHQIAPLQIRPSNLEDVFLKLTGQELGVHD